MCDVRCFILEIKKKESLFYAMALAMAYGLKLFYSRARADDLAWILAPTATLVSWLTGLSFVFDAAAGYVNGEWGIIIAPSCSGVNFMIIAFVMAFFSFAHRYETFFKKGRWLAVSMISAYGLTLFVNSVRICVSIITVNYDLHWGWFSAERIHRMEGIVIYFFFLCVYHHCLQRLTQKIRPETTRSTHTFYRILSPCFWYLTLALAVPIMTGHFYNHLEQFMEHALTVFLLCSAISIIFSWAITRHLRKTRQRHPS